MVSNRTTMIEACIIFLCQHDKAIMLISLQDRRMITDNTMANTARKLGINHESTTERKKLKKKVVLTVREAHTVATVILEGRRKTSKTCKWQNQNNAAKGLVHFLYRVL